MSSDEHFGVFNLSASKLDEIVSQVLGQSVHCFGELSIKQIVGGLGRSTLGIYQVVGHAKELINPVFDAYIMWLRKSGWRGDVEQVRLTYLTVLGCEAFRAVGAAFGMVDDTTLRLRVEKNFGIPTEQIIDQWGKPMLFFLDCADEATLLANRLAGKVF